MIKSYQKDEAFRTFVKEKIKSLNNQVSPHHKISRDPSYVQYYQARIEKDGIFAGGITGRYFWDLVEVDDLFVEEEYRGESLGKTLLEGILDYAKEKEAAFILLSTFSFQARYFYEKYGFYVIGEIKDYPPGASLYTMRKDLKKS